LDQLNLVPFSCGGASDAPQLAARVRRRSFTAGKIYRYNQALRLLLGASSPQDLKKAASLSATPS
jgi:hypothetical protein